MFKLNIFFNKENLFIIFLFSFSLAINQYYGNRGVFPVDSFSHFDTGFRILLGEYPFKDFWIVSGPLIDYIQALFFFIFGVNWQTYVLHASVFNGIITITTFIVLRNFQLNIYYSFIYSLFFSVLAYPVSGTPFVDLHSAFFSLLAIYILILAIKNEKNYHWFLLPVLFGFAFLSKQVPASYIIICVTLILIYYSLVNKKYQWIKYSFLGSIVFIISVLTLGNIQGIEIYSFLEQYIFYPQAIGGQRYSNLDINFQTIVSHFKFIYLAAAPLIYINIKALLQKKDYFKNKKFIYFLILTLFTSSLILHQILTRNQTFIFFLIPILAAFSHMSINSNKVIPSILLILFCLVVTGKYHFRFNENRKFHELYYTNFNLSKSAKKIDVKLNGLKWISPEFKNNPEDEINLINEIKIILKKDTRTKMVLTNYSFFSTIFEEKFFSTTRWHIFDGTDYPQKNSDYFLSYKKLFINNLKNNDVQVIYTIHPVVDLMIYNYIDKSCFDEKKISKHLVAYSLISCDETSK